MTHYTLDTASHYLATFDGSERLFRACWRQYIAFLRGSIDAPICDQDVADWLDSIAAEKVNDSRSAFYIYG